MTNNNSIKVLAIDDDDTFLAAVEDVLTEEGYKVLTTLSGEKGMKILRKNKDTRVILLDLRMLAGLSGEEVLRKLKKDPIYKDLPAVIVVTADRDVGKAMEMLEEGAKKFIVKPLTADELVSAVKDVITPPQNYKRVTRTGVSYDPKKGDTLQGRSGAMVSLMEEVFRVARLDSTVLLLGETGTGKELIAKTLHEHSKRRNKPFITIDCSGLPSNDLIHSELWGHEKSSFTGATSKREGRIHWADGGTVFLDEIGTLNSEIQIRLLRFCETKEFWPLGSDKSYKVDARIIAATNLDIEKAVKDKEFRKDFYYRLGQSIIEVPPLRVRGQRDKESETMKAGDPTRVSDDIEILVDYAMDRYNKTEDYALPVEGIEIVALELLKQYDWPGNARQLNHVINEAASRASMRVPNRVITKKDIESSRFFRATAALISSPRGTLTDLYKSMLTGDQTDARRFADKVTEMLNKAGGNISRASDVAGVSRVTMYKYIKEARKINLRS